MKGCYSKTCAGLLVLLLLAGGISLGEAKNPTPAKPQHHAESAATPAGMVPASEAVKRIEAHMDTIKQKMAEMEKVFGYYPSVDTMNQAFKKHGVNQKAMMYTDTWARGTLYWNWDTAALKFYSYHLSQLQESLYEFTMHHKPYISESDLTYLDQGMQAWLAQEPHYSSLLNQVADIKGQEASFLGKKMDLQEQWFKTVEGRSAIDRQKAQMQAQADIRHKTAKILIERVQELGKTTRLFSAINAPDRIAVTPNPVKESTSETHPAKEEMQCKEVFRPRDDVPDLRQQAIDALQSITTQYQHEPELD